MATTTVAAAGTALALYYYSRKNSSCTDAVETHTTAHSAPKSFLEDLYFFSEGMRYTYGETFGRWKTADLLIGLSYLSRREPTEHPVADIAQHGQVFGLSATSPEQHRENAEFLSRLERFMKYCSGLRERRPIFQRRYVNEVLGIPEEDLLVQELRAGVLKPSYILTQDKSLNAIVLAIRGTHSFKDAFTSLTGASKPHHVVDSNGVVLGYSHFGMLAAARWLKGQVQDKMKEALIANPGYKLYIVGHSLGGGTAAILTMILRESGGVFADATCTAIACPACMTLELAKSCSAYVTTVINNADVIPTISPGSADALRDQVAQSSWGRDFRQELRSSSIIRAVERGIRGMSNATSWTATRISACYQRRSFSLGAYKPAPKDTSNHRDTPTHPLTQSTTTPSKNNANNSLATIKRRNSDGDINKLSPSSSSPFIFSTTFQHKSNKNNDSNDSFSICMESKSQQLLQHQMMDNNEYNDCSDGIDEEEDEIEFDEQGVAALGIGQPHNSLEAEASLRLKEVAQAVSAAELEEAGQLSTVPSVIRPGTYQGNSSSTHARRQSDVEWRRRMYPAGRIMHLVPARLVPGMEGWNNRLSKKFGDEAENAGGNDEWPEAVMEEGVDDNRNNNNNDKNAVENDDEHSFSLRSQQQQQQPIKNNSSIKRRSSAKQTINHSRHTSELSLQDMITAEEASGSAAAGGGSTTGPLPPLKPAMGPPPEPMILLDGVPQEAYGRIKLCRTVLSDHVVPNYLRSLATFADRMHVE